MNEIATTTTNKPTIFDLLSNVSNNKKPCKIMELKDHCQPIPYGTLKVLSAGKSIIQDQDENEYGKTIEVDILSWNYIYLFLKEDQGVVAYSYDNQVIENTGELVSSFLESNQDVDAKIYTQFVGISNEEPLIVSVSQSGTMRFRQLLATLVIKGSDSSKMRFDIVDQKRKNKAYSYLNPSVI